jgi:hypothetical protein
MTHETNQNFSIFQNPACALVILRGAFCGEASKRKILQIRSISNSSLFSSVPSASLRYSFPLP